MKPRFVFSLLLALACLSAQGCAGVLAPKAVRTPAPASAPSADDLEHAELERELSLYSD